MKHSISEQIKGVQEAIRLLKILSHPMEERDWKMAEMLANSTITILNDAGSTLAALNLTKDLPEKEEFWNVLSTKMYWHIECCDAIEEDRTKEEILAMSYDRLKLQEDRIKELEGALRKFIDAEWMVTHDWGGDRQSVINEAESLLKQ